jgi:hypothetical protein
VPAQTDGVEANHVLSSIVYQGIVRDYSTSSGFMILNGHYSAFNPLDWVREKVAPTVREAQTDKEVEAAKEQAKKEGVASVFETTPPSTISKEEKALKAKAKGKGPLKPKPDSVRFHVTFNVQVYPGILKA